MILPVVVVVDVVVRSTTGYSANNPLVSHVSVSFYFKSCGCACVNSERKTLYRLEKKVVLHKLLSHLQTNNLCSPFQSAYRAGHNTETILLRVVNDILSGLDNDNISVLLLSF